MIRRAALVVAVFLLAACSATKEAVETGQEFTFVAPGGQTKNDREDVALTAEDARPDLEVAG